MSGQKAGLLIAFMVLLLVFGNSVLFARDIYDWHDLNDTRNNLDGYYSLQNDLDEDTAGYDRYVATTYGWDPIGDPENPFTGTFYGNFNEIYGLKIDHSRGGVGLFGATGSDAKVSEVGLVNVNVTRGWEIGGLIGENKGTVRYSYVSGSVSGRSDVGGLVGFNNGGTVEYSYSTGNVSGSGYESYKRFIGGLVGRNYLGTVSKSYSTASVSGYYYLGGLVGGNRRGDSDNDTVVKYSYSTGKVSVSSGGSESDVSEYVGTHVGGLLGSNSGSVNNSYWNTETSGQSGSAGGLGVTTDEMTWWYSNTNTESEYLCYYTWSMATYDNLVEETWIKGDHALVEDHRGNTGYPALYWQDFPEADFSYSPETPNTGDSVQFTDGSSPSLGNITSRSWDFGDGSTSTGPKPSHSYEDNGSYDVTLTVTDDSGYSDDLMRSVSVKAPPAKPSNPSTSNGATNVSTSPSLEVDVYDPDGDSMDVTFYDVYDNIIGTDSNVWSSSTASITWSGLSYGSTYSWYAVADDGSARTTSNTWSFTTNHTPTADAGGPYGIDEGDSLSLDGSGSTDQDGSIISYSWDLDDDGNYDDVSGATPTFSWSTLISNGLDDDGTYTLDLRVEDDDGATGTGGTVLTINNVAPTIDVLNVNPSPSDEGQEVSFEAAVTDPGAEEFTYSWTIGGRNYNENPVQITIFDDNSISWSLEVTDGDGGSDSTSGTHTVGNVKPTVNLTGGSEVYAKSPYRLSIDSVNDPGTDIWNQITVHWGDGETDTYSSLGDKQHTYVDDGNYEVTIDIVDEDGTFTDRENPSPMIATVNNVLPAANGNGPYSGARVETVKLDGTASSDPDGSIRSYEWTITAPDGSSIAKSGSEPELDLSASFYGELGDYEVSLSVIDDDGGTSSDSTILTVSNEPPTAEDDIAETNEDISVTIDVLRNDQDPDGTLYPFTVRVTSGPSHGATTVDNSNGRVIYNPASNYYGEDSFTYTVDDDDGATSNKATVSITVKDVNDPPTATFTYTPSDPKVEKEVVFDVVDSNDVDGNIVGYQWDLGDGTTAPGEEVTHTYNDKGTFTVTLTVTDNDGLTGMESTDLEVTYEVKYVKVKDPGWSLVSMPLEPENKNPAFIFDGVVPQHIFYWNQGSNDGQGQYLTPNSGFTITMNANRGIWIYLEEENAPRTFTVPGVYSGKVTITLGHPGWHQVGSPLNYNWSDIGVTKEGEDIMTVAAQSSGPSSPHWMSKFIYDYDTKAGEYTAYEAGNSSFTMKKGKAYWVRARVEDVKLIVPHAAPPPVPAITQSTPKENGIPMNSQKADRLNIPTPPAPPATYSVGEFSVLASPNPITNSNQVTFIASGSNLQSFQVNVFNASGKQLHTSPRQTDHTYTWEPQPNMTNGLYIYQVTARKSTGGTVSEIGKLLVLK